MDGRECGGAPQPHPDHHGGGLRPLRARGYGVCDRQQRGGDTPWPTQDKDGDNILNTSEFFEGGLDLTRMGLAFGCFNKVIFDTRSSQSLTATLFDFTLGTFLTCNDGNACTTDTCDPTRGCVFTPISCDDGNACTVERALPPPEGRVMPERAQLAGASPARRAGRGVHVGAVPRVARHVEHALVRPAARIHPPLHDLDALEIRARRLGGARVLGRPHGLGFAAALREAGLPAGEIPLALLSFNVGIEVGQILFVLGVLALGRAAGRQTQRMPGWARRAPVYGMGSLAGYWFLARALGLV